MPVEHSNHFLLAVALGLTAAAANLAGGLLVASGRWSREFLLNDLILAAFFTMLATLTRYDGWALFVAGSE